MLFLQDSEVETLLEHPKNVLHKLMHDKGRPQGTKTIPLEQKAMIGIFAKLTGPTNAANTFDVAKASASNYSHGSTITGRGNPELQSLMGEKIKNIHDITAEKLLSTLNLMDDEKIAAEKPLSQSTIAKNLAGIIEKTSDKSGGSNNVQVIVYAPQPIDSLQFKTIEVEAVEK